MFAEVQVLVLVAQDGQAGFCRLGVAPDERLDPTGAAVLVRHRDQWEHQADLLGDLRAPEPGRADDDVGIDDTVGGAHPGDPGPVVDDAEHLGVGT